MKRGKNICFIISPIGERGSEIRQNADDLLDLIIQPALDVYDLTVLRGDHRSEESQIDVDVINMVQTADLCIADISEPNPNVYYEVGRRDETGKHIILLKRKGTPPLPVDIGTRRYIEYDLDSRSGIRDARIQLRNFIDPIVENLSDSPTNGASLTEISETMRRLERKLDRVIGGRSESAIQRPAKVRTTDEDPVQRWKLALYQGDVQTMEDCLDALSVRTAKWSFLDRYVEITAGRGSQKAGELLIESASEFMDEPSMSFHQKIEYLGSLVSYANRSDREEELLDLVEDLCSRLEAVSDGEDIEDVAQIYNQQNRLYHGIFENGDKKDERWIIKAVQALKKVIELVPHKSYGYYNSAACYSSWGNHWEEAQECINKTLELDAAAGKVDDDHLELACTIAMELNDPGVLDLIEKLKKANPTAGALMEIKYARRNSN